MDDEPNEIDNPGLSDVDYLIHNIEDDDNDLAYGLHTIGKGYLQHFSTIKLNYKKLAGFWLFSLFVGMAFIIKNQTINTIGIDKLYVISMLTFLAIIGVNLLRYLDLKVYHPQQTIVFMETEQLEKKNPYLERNFTISKELLVKRQSDPILVDSLQYAAIEVSMALAGILALYLKLGENGKVIDIFIPSIILALVIIYQIITILASVKWGVKKLENNERKSKK